VSNSVRRLCANASRVLCNASPWRLALRRQFERRPRSPPLRQNSIADREILVKSTHITSVCSRRPRTSPTSRSSSLPPSRWCALSLAPRSDAQLQVDEGACMFWREFQIVQTMTEALICLQARSTRASSGAAAGDIARVRLVARSRARHRHALPAEARRALSSRAPRLSWCVALIGRRTPVDGRSLVDAFPTHSAPTTDARVAARVRVRQTVGYCRLRVTVCARRFGARSEALDQTITLLLDMRDAVEHKLAIDHILVAECGVQVRRLLPTFMQIERCRRLRACASLPADIARSWVLSLMTQHIRRSRLAYYAAHNLPMTAALDKRLEVRAFWRFLWLKNVAESSRKWRPTIRVACCLLVTASAVVGPAARLLSSHGRPLWQRRSHHRRRAHGPCVLGLL